MVRGNFSRFYVILFLLFIFPHILHAEEITKSFNYPKTVWIIQVVDSSGMVYGRPKPEDYNEGQGFIRIYNILIKYVNHMQELDSAFESQQASYQLILINAEAEQRLILGNHWISDGKTWATMDEVDYQNLAAWLGDREKLEGENARKTQPLNVLLKNFKIISSEIEAFDSYVDVEKYKRHSSVQVSEDQSQKVDDETNQKSEKSNLTTSSAASKANTSSNASKETVNQLISNTNSVHDDINAKTNKIVQLKSTANNSVAQQKEESISWAAKIILIISAITVFGLWFKFRR